MTYSSIPKAGNATASLLMRSLCSLMPISITLVTCYSLLSLPTANASASASAGSATAVNARGGATEEEPSVCSTGGGGTHKHSFRSTVRKNDLIAVCVCMLDTNNCCLAWLPMWQKNKKTHERAWVPCRTRTRTLPVYGSCVQNAQLYRPPFSNQASARLHCTTCTRLDRNLCASFRQQAPTMCTKAD